MILHFYHFLIVLPDAVRFCYDDSASKPEHPAIERIACRYRFCDFKGFRITPGDLHRFPEPVDDGIHHIIPAPKRHQLLFTAI